MAIIAKFYTIEWEVSPEIIKNIEGWDSELKIRTKTDGNTGKQSSGGSELRKLTLPYKASVMTGVDIRKEIESLRSIRGVIAPLYVNKRRLLSSAFMFESCQISNIELMPSGEIIKGDFSLSFVEVRSSLGTGGIRVYYNNTDITKDITVVECEHEMNAEDAPDEVTIKFSDNKHLWDKWQPNKADIIKVVNGVANTGKMFIQSVLPTNGYMTLTASSVPESMRKIKKENNKSWQGAMFLQVITEIAARNGLTLESHDVENRMIPFVELENVSYLDFLTERCELEGCAFVVYDGKLIVYSPDKLSQGSSSKTINVPADTDFKYDDNSAKAYGSCELDNGSISGMANANNGIENTKRKILEGYIDNQAEANMYAQNVLAKANRGLKTGTFESPIMRDLSAASIATLKTAAAATNNGKIFYTKIRQDYVKQKTKHFFRFV